MPYYGADAAACCSVAALDGGVACARAPQPLRRCPRRGTCECGQGCWGFNRDRQVVQYALRFVRSACVMSGR